MQHMAISAECGFPVSAGRRLQRTVQLLLLLAAYLLVTAMLKSSLDLSKRTCCVLAFGDPLSALYRIA